MPDFIMTTMELLGIKRTEDLLFKCRSDLKGKATEVRTIKENCIRCGQPTIFAWTFMQDGLQKSYRVSDICTGCKNGVHSKQVTDEMIQKRKDILQKKWYHIPEYDTSGFKNYEVINKATESALATAIAYTKEILTGHLNINLLFEGSTGTGKSHLAKTIAKTAKEKGLQVAYIGAADLFGLIKNTFGHDRHNEMLYEEFKSFDIMVIDDVGLETKKQGELTWSVSEWTKLINAREGKATIYTTNFDDAALAEVIGQRAFSRMYMNSRFIDLFTDDYRKKLMKK